MNEIMDMPIQDRKYFIMKHNQEQQEIESKRNGNRNKSITGDSINTFAELSQKNATNQLQ